MAVIHGATQIRMQEGHGHVIVVAVTPRTTAMANHAQTTGVGMMTDAMMTETIAAVTTVGTVHTETVVGLRPHPHGVGMTHPPPPPPLHLGVVITAAAVMGTAGVVGMVGMIATGAAHMIDPHPRILGFQVSICTNCCVFLFFLLHFHYCCCTCSHRMYIVAATCVLMCALTMQLQPHMHSYVFNASAPMYLHSMHHEAPPTRCITLTRHLLPPPSRHHVFHWQRT